MSNIIDSIQLSGVTYTIQGSGGGGVPESTFTAYTAATDARIAEDEEVTAAALNELNEAISGVSGNNVVELTQAEYDALVTGGTVDPTAFYIITDATAGDLTQYWTSAQTQSAITSAVSGKVDKSAVTSSVTSASTDAQIPTAKAVYDAVGSGGGGGKAIEAGRGISITTGETADTVSFNLPISADSNTYINAGVGNTNNNTTQNILIGSGNTAYNGSIATNSGATAIGFGNRVGYIGLSIFANSYSFALGYNNVIQGGHSYAIGYNNNIGSGTNNSKNQSFLIGYYNTCTFNGDSNGDYIFGKYCTVSKSDEFALGKYNASNTGSTDADKTFFSIGNGTADNARHNAFEIRQNGDIYLTLDGQYVKLQDQIGGSSITVDTALDSGSTNPVENRVIYNKIDEVEQVTAAALNNINDRLSEDEEVTAAGLNAVNSALGGLKLQQITQSAYDALTTKDPSTLYIIVNFG